MASMAIYRETGSMCTGFSLPHFSVPLLVRKRDRHFLERTVVGEESHA